MSEFTKRTLAAGVMAPIAIGAVLAGPVAFALLCWAGALVVHAEWQRLTGGGGRRGEGLFAVTWAGGAVLTLAALLAVQGMFGWAVIAVGAGAPALALLPPRGGFWRPLGVVYAGVPLLALVKLRQDSEVGAGAVLWLLLVVWATDICAYLAGRAIGGPLLWPRVSPKKTWAGLGGALVGAARGGGAAAFFLAGRDAVVPLVVLAVGVALVAHCGDFAESALKRRFSVKDAGTLIPGHGGLMDRVDGLIAASLLVLGMGLVRAGFDAPAQGVLIW